MRWVWIFVGGGLGSVGRVALGQWIAARAGTGFPWHTLTANVLGCFTIGVVAAWLAARGAPRGAHAFLVAGVLGGFTTFSSFGLETYHLLEAARPAAAAANAAASLVLCLLAVSLGFALARAAL